MAKKDTGYVSAHRSKMAAERQAKTFGGKVVKTPKGLQKVLRGKPYMVKLD